MLKNIFTTLLKNYTEDTSIINEHWTEIEKSYLNKKRFYHNLTHLENLYLQLSEVKGEIENWDCILFSLFYHDVIYNSLKSDNEERSAVLAECRMKEVSVPQDLIDLRKKQILATKYHVKATEKDTNYFTDADLSIIGQPFEVYQEYFKAVRKEYSIFPDVVYKPGRKKVLNHFLAMERIFKTDFFYQKFEGQAKENLQMELSLLK
jgi:predicted metal-dependent HD superfamily phosphohydrolase